MYSFLSRKEQILHVVVFVLLLFTSTAIVAFGQVVPPAGEASGICLIRNNHTNLKGFADPDVGKGYAKAAKPGVYTFARIREACTKSDFDALLRSYCAQNPTDTEQYGAEVVGFDKAGRFLASGGCPACDQPYRCPPPPQPPAEKEIFTYPIAELGGCGSAEECHEYCEKPEHKFGACWEFAKKYDLISQTDIEQVKKFITVVARGGPGGCHSEKECIEYCESSGHLDECLAFAGENGFFTPDKLVQAKRFGTLITSGQSPGGCQSKSACVAYCADESHSEECVLFLEKAGFVTQQEAHLIRKFKGKSPGDCATSMDSFAQARSSCNAFCNDPVNQPVCFRFLEEAGIMTAEEATQAGALSDFQACIPFAPEEIQQCFIDNLGRELFVAMKQGVLLLEENIEEFMGKIRVARRCVNRYVDQSLATVTDNPTALACINSELGKEYLEKAKRGEVTCGDAAQSQKKLVSCMEAALSANIDHCFSLSCSEATTCLKRLEDSGEGSKMEISFDLKTKIEGKINACVVQLFRTCLAQDCGKAIPCIERIQGGAQGEETGGSTLDPGLEADIAAKFTACSNQKQDETLRPADQRQEPQYQTPEYRVPEYQTPPPPQIPDGSSYDIPTTPELCASFSSVTACSYTGSPDSQNYQLCKKCYPER